MSGRSQKLTCAAALLASAWGVNIALAQVADTIYIKANVITMDARKPSTAIAIKGDKILGVGTDEEMKAFAGSGTSVVGLKGVTILPGFIDAHSHLLGYAFYTDSNYWTDVSAINEYFKPSPRDARCTDPTDPQKCFIPVKTHEDVVERIQKAAAVPGVKAVYAFNYDPSRLGHGPTCPPPNRNVAFQCPNFEQGHARTDLDAISTTIPIFVSSQSGHISYVNTKGLALLNICGTPGATASCYAPVYNPTQELALAQSGQLDEDVSLYAEGVMQGQIISDNKAATLADINRGADIYSEHGYTLTQEGAAGTAEVELYLAAMVTRPIFPVTVGLVMYNPSTDFTATINEAAKAKQMIAGFPNLFVAALKNFADGSPQGFTAYFNTTYRQTYAPFSWSVFPSPYTGQPDTVLSDMQNNAIAAHKAGYPLMVHNNGNQATLDTVQALTNARAVDGADYRDIVLHAPFLDKTTLAAVAANNDVISFLIGNLYYFGLPLCQQVLSPTIINTYKTYPGADAEKAGLTVTLHSDAPVNPPDPLFEVYISKTRRSQQPSWYPNFNTSNCSIIRDRQQALTVRQGLEAVTINVAKQYGMESVVGTITAGKQADLVFLSANPLAMEDTPERLKTIRILGTVHRGHFRANPHALEQPIWPD